MKKTLILLAGAALASQVNAQTTMHYWNFESLTDVVGGAPTAAIGTPDLSVHGLYGSAYAGSGQSLNIVFGTLDFMSADVHDGVNPTGMDFGTNDFSFSYWSYDAFAVDADTKGPRIFDCLAGTTTGIQLGTNATPLYNFRVDDNLGGVTISNNTLPIGQPADAWVHVAVNVNRTGGVIEIFFNGASQGTAAMANVASGTIHATQDMDIGYINSDGGQNQAQESGLDDLAFYDGLLSAGDITGLANGTLTPMSFAPTSGTSFCWGDGSATICPCGNPGLPGAGCANSTGSGGVLTEGGTLSALSDDLTFGATGLVPNQPALLFSGFNEVNGSLGLIFGDGLRCAGGSVVRLGVRVPDAGGVANWLGGGLGAAGGWGSGDTRSFQAWYRDPAGSPCGSGFNLSNGVSLTFVN